MPGPTPLALGGHAFEALGFSFQDLDRQLDTSWSELDTAMRFDALHWTGPKSEQITIKGVLFPEEFGGPATLDRIRADAQAGRPMQLVTAAGRVYGRFVVTGVSDDNSLYDARGQPRRGAYQISLKRYAGGGGGGALGAVLARLF